MGDIWQRVVATLRERTNEHNFNLWFRPIRLLDITDTHWVLSVPNGFLRDWITDNYLDILERSLYEVTREDKKVRIEIEAVTQSDSVASDSAPTSAARPPKRRRRTKVKPTIGIPLNERFRFDRFVIGASNEFAHAACQAVARQPGGSYNPLFIYGGTGLGKTHLLQAIGYEALRLHPETRVAYITSERFMSELIQSISSNQMADFKRRYRDMCDVLLMDDIQFLAGKSSTQEEFFHTFNFLFESGKQVVVTSDQYPQEIKTLDERIRSRLRSGLVADIKTPDLETRAAILKKKADLDGFAIDDDVLRFLAKNVRSNVRELEGSLIRLEAYISLTGASCNMETAKEVLRSFIQTLPPDLNAVQIQKRVCKYFSVSQNDLLSKSRARKLVIPRQIAMFLVKRYTDLSLKDIGASFGGKDHSTVIAAINRVERLLAEDMKTRDTIDALEKQLVN